MSQNIINTVLDPTVNDIFAFAEGVYRGTSDYLALELVYFDPQNNQFFDQCGKLIFNIYDWLLPSDIEAFRKDVNNCCFPLRYDSQVLVEIVCENNDAWTQETLDAWTRWNVHDEDWDKLVKGVYS